MAGRMIEACLLAGVSVVAVMVAAPAHAQNVTRHEYSIAEQDLGDALRSLSRQTGKEILFDAAAVAGKRSPSLKGKYTVDEAVHALLAGTDLRADIDASGITVRGRDTAPGQVGEGKTAEPNIEVTGSRIGGGSPTSPVITLTQRELKNAGFTNLSDVLRTIPENFAGGQNPTVAGGGNQGAANQNTTSSSTFNLRGLGPDATLTLLNGHRMPYDGVFQGVDIASIPLSAVERIEVVTDGASAIYGSDAVAGVANVILKRSFDGLQSYANVGGSMDGGNQQLRTGAVMGSAWRSGGIMAAVDFSRQTEILAGDRDYASAMQAEQTLVPWLKQYSALASGHQELGAGLRLEMDGTYNRRKSRIQTPFSPAANYLRSGALSAFDVETFSLSPTLRADLAPGWAGYLMGTYAKSAAHLFTKVFSNNAVTTSIPVDYVNTLKTVETGLSGTLFSLPGGPLKLAAGGGYRSNVLDALSRSITATAQQTSFAFTKGQDSWFGYAELNAPLVAADNNVPLVRKLVVTAAIRYESYADFGEIVTPKAGFLYAPVDGLEFTLSWGRSFKAPTFYQQYLSKSVALRSIAAYGATQFPAGSTVLLLSGGNSESLRPERAENLTIATTVRPAFLPDAQFQLSYYRVRYRDRVITPITSSLGLFSNPYYAPVITLTPASTQIAAALANAPGGLTILSGGPYDPARVVAIVDNRYRNSSSQHIQGIDMNARYGFRLGDGDVQLAGNFAYLDTRQSLLAGQPSVQLAGLIYNPASWRARGGLQWENTRLAASTYVNYSAANRDRRISPERSVPSFTTWDAAITYKFAVPGSYLDGLELGLAANNILNTAPGRIRQGTATEPVYDSTNANPIGRYLSLTVRKQW
ncbi:TonB-dependent receptor [Sphingomonas sp. OTU376]|uniref:TonB-dependent receptor n=1 Tax=Sphingomonas sp. OTU376 TaxID=3043863 RepID=UPI00313DDF76